MWSFRKHRQLKPEALSEYLDGRLRGAMREKVARELESCASCREELESLRATVLLLQDLPEVRVPQAFTLAGPPPVPVAASRPQVYLRMPGWAYAGAASLAGLALAVLVSADATGLLTPGPTAVSPRAFSAAAPAQEHAAATATPDTLAATAPTMAPTTGPEPSEDASPKGPAGAQGPSAADREPPPPAPSPAEDRPSEQAAVAEPETPPQRNASQERGTPLVWRVLEGVAAALALAFLAGLVLRWRQSRRVIGN